MKTLILAFLLFVSGFGYCQITMTLTPQGFAPIEFRRPEKDMEKIVEISRAWADHYNKKEYDVYDITDSSLKIDGVRENAFYYRNRGEIFHFNIRYTMDISFTSTNAIIAFSVKDIFARQTLSKTIIADFFTPDGRIKDDFEEVKPSLEETAADLINSYASFIAQ